MSVQMQSIIARSNSTGVSIAEATAQLGINPVWLTWERSALVLLLIFLAGWMREEVVPAGNTTSNNTSISDETMRVILTKLEKLDYLEQVINSASNNSVTVVPEPVTIPETPVTKAETETPDQPVALLPAVPGVLPDEVKSVVDAYLAGIAKREICTYLKWGSNKYSSKVKPVLDAFLSQEQFVTDR